MFYGNKSAPVSCPCNRVRETHTHTPVACGAWQELLTSQNVAPCWAQEMYSSLLAVYKSSVCLPDLNHAQPRIIRMKLPKMPTYSHISITFPSHFHHFPISCRSWSLVFSRFTSCQVAKLCRCLCCLVQDSTLVHAHHSDDFAGRS